MSGEVEALRDAIAGQNLYHGRYGTTPAGHATAMAILSSLKEVGWQLTRVGDEERLRAATVVLRGALEAHHEANRALSVYQAFVRGEAVCPVCASLAALDAAPQPPSPAACPICGASNEHTYIGGEDYPDHRWQPPSPASQGEER